MLTTYFFIFSVVFLIGMFALTSVNNAFRRIHKRDSKKRQKTLGNYFFYRKFHLFFFPHHEFEGLFFASMAAQTFTRFCYAASLGCLFAYTPIPGNTWPYTTLTIIIIVVLLLSYFLGDFLPRLLGARHPDTVVRLLGGVASIFLLITFPFSYVFLKLWQMVTHSVYFETPGDGGALAKQEILDIIEEAGPQGSMDTQEQKIFESVVTFRDRIAREVMVPRVDTFCLPANTPIKEAALLLQEEGYSRTPVYKNTVDEILGVLMWKDLLVKYMEYEALGKKEDILEEPIESILKPVIYTPETKKISLLLQEFRKKQMHLAIVVDEYGGTEGIVTIEDILEEIVGEIEDEYDEQPPLFTPIKEGGWIVDARMSIYDISNELSIEIPQEGDFDTLGGYIFHKAGAIPPIGFVIEHDMFTLEVITSSERSIGRVKIQKR